jgi:hypothetical protein
MLEEAQNMTSASRATPKKRYRKPILKVYGDIQALTATVSNMANADTGTGAMNRTH